MSKTKKQAQASLVKLNKSYAEFRKELFKLLEIVDPDDDLFDIDFVGICEEVEEQIIGELEGEIHDMD